MHFDKFKEQILGRMTPDELLAKRDEVLRIFAAEDSVRFWSVLPFLSAWMAVGKALDRDLGEYAVWIWLCLAFVGVFLTQVSSRVPWRIWVGLWGIISLLVMDLHHEWKLLTIAGLSLAVGILLIAVSQEKRAEALGLAGKYDLLNANGQGRVGDVLSVRDILELHQEEERMG
jgi:hypothetical protein